MTPEEIAKLPYRPCVGIMIINKDGLVFVANRIDSPKSGWQMPQGGIEEGEEPRDALFRELGEETGLEPSMVSLVAECADWISYDLPEGRVQQHWNGRYRGQTQKWFLLRFNAEDDQINIDTDEPEFSEWRWQDPSELPGNVIPMKQKTYAAVLAEFSPHL